MSQNLGCCLWVGRLSLLARSKEFSFWASILLREEKTSRMTFVVWTLGNGKSLGYSCEAMMCTENTEWSR